MLTRFRFFTMLATVVALGSLAMVAQALEAPNGPIVLTVSGKIAQTNQDGKAVFDMATLRSLPQKTFVTETAWDKRPVKFSGPLMRDVLQLLKNSGTEIKAVAINDYAVAIPVSDAQKFDLIIATRMNDRDIPPRTKGPLFIVYPFSSTPELKEKIYEERAIWQLTAMELR